MFAKLFEDDFGQIVVLREVNDEVEHVSVTADFHGITATVALACDGDVDQVFESVDHTKAAELARIARDLAGAGTVN